MDYETLFSAASLFAMSGWLMLVFSPLIPNWSDRYAGWIVPLFLSVLYIGLALQPNGNGGGFGSLQEVGVLFTDPTALFAGWVHFLAFDLFVGAWICRTARQSGIHFGFVLPCLPMTFLYGPLGFLAFSIVRFAHARIRSA